MTDQYVPPLRRRFLEDMRIKGLQPKTQTMYLRAMREFTRWLCHGNSGKAEKGHQSKFKPQQFDAIRQIPWCALDGALGERLDDVAR